MRRLVPFLTSISLMLAASVSPLSPAAAMVVPFSGTFIIAEPGGVALFGGGLIALGTLVALRRWRMRRRTERRAFGRARRRRWWPFRRLAAGSRRSLHSAARR